MSYCVDCIWEKFNVPLKRFIMKRVVNEQDADDILQEIFIKIHTNMGNLMDHNKIHVWIYSITRNTIIDYYRKSNKKYESTELLEDIESFTEDELSFNLEIAHCLKNMIDKLPKIYKQAILLTEFENMTQKELSEKMGISISGAKSRVQRARKKLKEMLLECCRLEIDRRGNIIEYKHKSDKCKYC